MRVEEGVAQQRSDALLFIGSDAMFHAVCPFVPFGRVVTRVFGQVLFVDAVCADKAKGVQASLFGECEHVVGG